MAPTEALYLDNSSLHTTTAQLIFCQPVSSLDEDTKRLAKNIAAEDFAVVTQQTIFYAQGGGQASDIGFIARETQQGHSQDQDGKFEVLLVRKTLDGTILHFGRFLATEGLINQPPSSFFSPDQPVSLSIDRAKRNYHSRLHTAGHILGLAMHQLEPILGRRQELKANHFPGEASLEFEGLLYNDKHKSLIQEKVDDIVAQGLPVKCSWWEPAQVEAKKEELRLVEGRLEEVGAMGRVRVAEIADLDASPCGGTHVESTALTGRITIRKISRVKGGSRVSYEVPVNFDF
ncbi:Threonyl/alanyl tRNA synthetase [Aspergillus germanicus]